MGCITLTYVVDYYNSDNTRKNYQVTKAAGYSDAYLMCCGFFVNVVISFMVYLDVTSLPHYTEDLWIPGASDLSLVKLCTAAALVAMTDWLFYLFHKALHEHFPRIHVLHHCCIHTSLSTNLCFEPLDVLAEFSAPGLFLKLCTLHVLNDSWTGVLATAIMGTYYGLSHDEWMNLQHAKHHRGCATGYFIYHNYFYGDSEKEAIKPLIPGLVKGNSPYPMEKKD